MQAPADSLAAELLELSELDRKALIGSLTEEQAERLLWDWRLWARPSQIYDPHEGEVGRLYRMGRGSGKTRAGAEATREVAADPERCGGRIALVGRTAADVRSTMLYGESGLLTISPPWFRPTHNPSKRLLTWPHANALGDNYSGAGAVAETYSADKPEQLRGPNTGFAWLDELAHWRDAQGAFDQVQLGLRLGMSPRWIGTTTPLPTKLIRTLCKDDEVTVVAGSTYENILNLAPTFISKIVKRYEGTRLGRQELEGEILDDNPNALWSWEVFRRVELEAIPDLVRIVVAIDPAVTANASSDLTGIVVVGICSSRILYVLEDVSGRYTPRAWALKALEVFDAWRADRIVAEVNNGGDLVEANIRTVRSDVPFSQVRASRGKAKRAEPVASYYEQGKAFHVGDPRRFVELEGELTEFDPTQPTTDQDDDRLDALVWGATELIGGEDVRGRLRKLVKGKAFEKMRGR